MLIEGDLKKYSPTSSYDRAAYNQPTNSPANKTHKMVWKYWNYSWSKTLEINQGFQNFSIQDILCWLSNNMMEAIKQWRYLTCWKM